jgi:hypothetical protein
MKRILELLWQTLREIFDEAAYERFLKRHGACRGRHSYAGFLRDSRRHDGRRPRCC